MRDSSAPANIRCGKQNRPRSPTVCLDRGQPGLVRRRDHGGRPIVLATPGLPTLAKAEPKTLRYRLLHTAARIVRSQRKRRIRIPET